ncbi:tripartite tricarboxylate transporter substrate-binding protein [Bradyrhizobium sp. AZCC 2289]|uniref:tripartite tricarboxylate transporter substrate-binding protein n=1 Tax=Bradyrhizobium sp. AZCC 2289 TaxID=3117026 RepID=UPI002FF1BAE6
MRLFVALFALVACLLAFTHPSRAETRVALVIGNGAYLNVSRLPNPANDAADVAAALRHSGFDTILAVDLNRSGMDDAVIKFARAARTADVAMFYYSGHALQFGGVNYLAPVDADLKDEADLRRMTRVDEIVSDLQQAKNLRILVLDSCRENPLADQLKRSIGSTRALPLQRGLARIDSPQGMIVAYATQAGRTAEDGVGRNSPYTASFLKHIEEQEEIGTIFRRVSSDVYEATKHEQLPELSLSLIGEFYLRGRLDIKTPVTAPTADPCAAARDHWKSAEAMGTVAALKDHLTRFPNCAFSGLASARVQDLETKMAAVVPTQPIAPSPMPGDVSGVFTTRLVATGAGPGTPPPTSFPNRPVKLIVPGAPGGLTDVTARTVGEHMSRTLGQQVVIENRPGASGSLGMTSAMKASADGYTLVVGTSGVFVAGLSQKTFDPAAGFDAVGLIGASPIVVAAKRDIPGNDLNSLRSYLANGSHSFGSSGIGLLSHIACQQFIAAIKVNATHIPFRGTGPAVSSLSSGDTDFMCDFAGAFAANSNVKVIVTASTERLPSLPNVPTTAEAGLPNFRISLWSALLAPKGTPTPVIEKLNFALVQALDDAPTREKLRQAAVDEMPTATQRSPQAANAFLRAEVAKWTPVIKAAGIN